MFYAVAVGIRQVSSMYEPNLQFIYICGKLDVLVSKVNCNFRENPLEFSDIHSRRINSEKLVYTYGIKQTSTYVGNNCHSVDTFGVFV